MKLTFVVPQSSTDWSTRSATGATSLVKEHDQFDSCLMYSTTEGIESAVFKAQGEMVEISTQQIIYCDTTDDDCIGCDLITVFNCVMDAESIDVTLITRSRAMEDVVVVGLLQN